MLLKGQRVKVTKVDDSDGFEGLEVGMTGTVQEDSHCPWVLWDQPIKSGDNQTPVTEQQVEVI